MSLEVEVQISSYVYAYNKYNLKAINITQKSKYNWNTKKKKTNNFSILDFNF
jgi:hypothetical protein